MEKKSLKVNFIMNILLTMSSFIFPLITFPYVSRILLPIGTGKVAFATSFINYLVMLSQLGIPTYGIRACAKVRDNKEELSKTAQELLIINLIMSGVSYIILSLSIIFIPKFNSEKELYLVIGLTILLSSLGMEWLYKSLEQYTYITIRSLTFKVIALIVMFLCVKTREDYIKYGGITILAASASNILNFFNARRFITFKFLSKYNIKKHLKAVGIFFAIACATTVYTNLDNLMLGFISGEDEVGLYNASVKIKTVLVSIVASLGTVLLPRASYYIEKNEVSKFKQIICKALNIVILLAIPFMVFFSFYASEVIYVLSGPAYAGAIIPMQIIMPTVLFIGITNLFGIQILVPLGREREVLKAVICGGIIDVIVNILFIPSFASSGAAIGTLIAEFVVLLVEYKAVREEVVEAIKRVKFFPIIISSFIGLTACLWVKKLDICNIIKLLLSSGIFFSCYGAGLLFLKNEIATEAISLLINKVKKYEEK